MCTEVTCLLLGNCKLHDAICMTPSACAVALVTAEWWQGRYHRALLWHEVACVELRAAAQSACILLNQGCDFCCV